jgi:hypothetical protein
MRIGTTVNRQEAEVMLLILMSASDRSGLRSLVIQHHYNRSSRPSEKLISASAISVRGSASSPVQIVIEDGANTAIACGRIAGLQVASCTLGQPKR